MQSDSARLSVVMGAFAVVVFLASVASASLSHGEQPWLGPLSVVVLLPGTTVLKAMLYVLGTGLPLMLWVFLVGVVSWAFFLDGVGVRVGVCGVQVQAADGLKWFLVGRFVG